MPSPSFFKTLSFLLFTLPNSILAAPQGTFNGIARIDHDPLLKYNISAAQMQSIDAVNPAGATGKQNSLNITVSGVQPGDQPINCFGSWFYDTTQDQAAGRNQAGSSDFVCSDPKLKVTSDQFYQVGTKVEFFVLITYTGFDLAKWYTNTGYDFAWKCEAGGTICRLKAGFVQDSLHTEADAAASRSTAGNATGGAGALVKPGEGRGSEGTSEA